MEYPLIFKVGLMILLGFMGTLVVLVICHIAGGGYQRSKMRQIVKDKENTTERPSGSPKGGKEMNLYETLVSVLEDLRQDPNQEYRGFVHGCEALMDSEGKIFIYQFEPDRIVFELEEGAIINHVNPKTHRHPGGFAHILREFSELLAERLEAKLGQKVSTRYKRHDEFSELLAGSKNWKKELKA